MPAAWAQNAGRSTEKAARAPMAAGRPSRTAQGAALLRAAHQLLDRPPVLEDPLALRIIGARCESALRADPQQFDRSRSLRAFVAMRSRYAEDELKRAVSRGVRQYVILGAGLDTSAYRNSAPELRIFEVDHPATQAWKRQRLDEANIAIPPELTFVAVDFETQTLGDALSKAGFRTDEPAFFSWLGVVVYLTRPAVIATLEFVAALAPGTEIVFSYSLPSHMLSVAERSARAIRALRMTEMGEPWRTYFEPQELVAELGRIGFGRLVDFDAAQANARYFGDRADGLRLTGSGRMMTARV